MGVIQKIAEHYKIKTSDIIDGDIAQILSDSSCERLEPVLLKKYRALDEHGKKLVDAVLNIEYERVVGKQSILPEDLPDIL